MDNIALISRKELLPNDLAMWAVAAEGSLNKTHLPDGRPDVLVAPLDGTDVAISYPELKGRQAVFTGHCAEYNGFVRYIYSHIE